MKIAGVFAGIIAFIVILVLSWGAWHLSRMWSYNLSYESMVEHTVCEMVKEEYLKKEC